MTSVRTDRQFEADPGFAQFLLDAGAIPRRTAASGLWIEYGKSALGHDCVSYIRISSPESQITSRLASHLNPCAGISFLPASEDELKALAEHYTPHPVLGSLS